MAERTARRTRKVDLGKCSVCPSLCCGYVALPIETPKTRGDYDDIRWYLAHKKVCVFIEDGDWYIQFFTPCRYRRRDGACAIYETRPRICRKYDHEECEYYGEEGYDYDALFESVEQIEAYRDEQLKRRKKKRRKERKSKK